MILKFHSEVSKEAANALWHFLLQTTVGLKAFTTSDIPLE
jgi:hypothetical protein